MEGGPDGGEGLLGQVCGVESSGAARGHQGLDLSLWPSSVLPGREARRGDTSTSFCPAFRQIGEFCIMSPSSQLSSVQSNP